MGDSVHCVGNTHPVPVNRSLLGQIVSKRNFQPVALFYPDFGTRDQIVVTPDIGFIIGLGYQAHSSW